MNDFLKNVGGTIIKAILLLFAIYLLGFILQHTIERKNPPAIEVYRGNTTLEITYKDGIPIDSVVVYK